MPINVRRNGSRDMSVSHLRRRYLWGPAVDEILAEEEVDGGTADLVAWTLTDHLNTVRDIAKYDPQTGTTTVVNHLVYDAFGRVTSESNPAVDSLFLFTARPFDADTGLQNNLHRWYDPAVGRWLSEDPIGFGAGDGNLYRYVRNTPENSFDPTGRTIIAIQPIRPRPGWWPDWLFWPYDERGRRECRESFDPSDLVCPIAGVARKQALKHIRGLAQQIEGHLAKLAKEPGAFPAAHWKHEIREWIRRVEELLPCVGKKTGQEIKIQVQTWKDQLERLTD